MVKKSGQLFFFFSSCSNLQLEHDHVTKEPIVNKVCFCFPFSFLPFVCVVVVVAAAATDVASPDTVGPSPTSPCSSTLVVLLLPRPLPPPPSPIEEELLDCCLQAETTGPVVLPKIFFNETLPLTCGFVLDAVKLGNSGKSVLESLGGGVFILLVGVLLDVDVIVEDDVGREDADQGVVLRCA